MATTQARSNRERGAVAVEFAVLLPVLLMILLGIIEFGIAFNHQQGLHAAAREGARLASLPTSTSSQINTRVTDSLNGTGLKSPTISISPSAGQPCLNRSGQTVTVTVSANQDIRIPFWKNETVTLTGKGVFQCE